MDKQVNIYEAKSHFSRLVRDVEAGASIVIARQGRPVARLVRFIDKVPNPAPERDPRTAWCEIIITASGDITATCGDMRLEGRVHRSRSLSFAPTTAK
jgi:antitoxin (DNA-binding transcriptional repressor) of toxin-antitoxin stability system